MLDQLQGQLAALGKASGGGVQDETARRFEETRSRLLAAEAAWKVFQGDIASKYPIAKGAAFPLARVQKALGKQTALLGWLVMETKPGESAYWGYVIRGSGPARWARLGIPSQGGEETSLLETPRAFREELVTTAGWRSRVTSVDAITEDAAALWAGWLAPLEPYLEGAKNLVVIPSGPMLGVPVEALVDSAGNYLEDRWAISYAPSATILTWLREKAAERPGGPIHAALLVGDPPFSDDQLAVMEGMEEDHPELSPASTAEEFPAQASLFRSALAGDGAALAALPRLPKTREETERIASLMPEATILLGPEASEQELVDLAEGEALARFDVIHLATHALVDDERPECSALVLSRANLPEPLEAAMAGTRIFDGLLTVNEVVREWRLDADLVTLSGCRTALGKEASGEGYVGLAYAFLQAGARSLLVSLWRVEDEATCLLMGRFYENLTGHYGVERGGRSAKPMPKTEALQEAKHWLRTYTDGEGQQPFRHPVYWSGFVLIGDPG
jgi:CHAT domain-containing protein